MAEGTSVAAPDWETIEARIYVAPPSRRQHPFRRKHGQLINQAIRRSTSAAALVTAFPLYPQTRLLSRSTQPLCSAAPAARLRFGNICKLTFKCLSDASVKRAAQLAQQCAVSCVLNQGMLEQIGRMRGTPCGNTDPAADETVECGYEFRFRFTSHRS